MNTPCKFSCTNDEELISYYPEPDYWQTIHEQQSLYNSLANNQKKQQFIKSPLIIYNHCYTKGAVETAYLFRQLLEREAKQLPVYIRPILLFLVPSVWNNNPIFLQRLKQQFITGGIPKEEIAIKTSILDELTNVELRSETCNIRYVITSSDLTGNWRCPFAYVMVSMDERHTPSHLLTILNCMLPLPYSYSHSIPLLNAGYILTANTRFEEIKTHIQLHLHDLNVNARHFIAKDNLVHLLKQLSVFELLKEEVQYGFEEQIFHPDKMSASVIKDIQKLISDYGLI